VAKTAVENAPENAPENAKLEAKNYQLFLSNLFKMFFCSFLLSVQLSCLTKAVWSLYFIELLFVLFCTKVKANSVLKLFYYKTFYLHETLAEELIRTDLTFSFPKRSLENIFPLGFEAKLWKIEKYKRKSR